MASLTLASAAFSEGDSVPRKHTCDGADVSPPLSWTGVPEKARSLVLIVEDPDAPAKTWVHWVLFDLPASATGLPEGVPSDSRPPGGGVHGVNDFGNPGYGGPCPPSGTHRYVFVLAALDDLLNLPPGASRAAVGRAMKGHVLGEARLTGRYARSRS